MIFDRLKRIETKIGDLSKETKVALDASKTTNSPRPMLQPSPRADVALIMSPPQLSDIHKAISTTGSTYSDTKLSFSAHQAVHWPGLHTAQSYAFFPPGANGSGAYLADIELESPAFPEDIQTSDFPEQWLDTLSLSTVKGLSNAYFNTFNRIFPFLDRDYYFANTLSSVVGQGFGYDIDSCLVLSVMALGCLGAKAFEEGDYHNDDKLARTGVIHNLMVQDVPGKALFIESRRRIGACSCSKDIEISQYYLTAALFYSQAMRPVHQWMMTDRASTNCLLFWNHARGLSDEWSADMQSRVFWSSLLMEAVIVQELDLPRSRLRELEDVVPLPKFIPYPLTKKSHSSRKDDSYFSYHFLAQIAHRIILTRIRDELYHPSPSTMVASELRHQLDQWHANLPPALQFGTDNDVFSCPAEAYAMSLLKTRFRSAIYHLGRPFLYKALASPSSVTDQELSFCSEALQVASNWPIATGICRKMGSFSPLKYLVSCSFFGTLVISHALKQSGNERLVKTLPSNSDAGCDYMLQYIEELAPMSPSLQKDCELLSMLYHPAMHSDMISAS
jgi:hypothetical protein